MELLHVARVPPVTASPETTVLNAVQQMADAQVGAIVVTDSEKKVLGIFTERDNMLRVTLKGLDPQQTHLSEVMTAPVATASPDITPAEALARMIRSRLPIVDSSNRILGIVSVRQLLKRCVSEQEDSIEVLAAYVEAGGPG